MRSKLVLKSASLDNFQVHIPVSDTNDFARLVSRVNDLSLRKKKRNAQETLDNIHDAAEFIAQVGSAATGGVAVGGLVGIALQLVLKTSLAVAKSYAQHHDIKALKEAIDSCANSCKHKDYAAAIAAAEAGLREVESFNKGKLVSFLNNRESEFKSYRFALKLLLKYNLAAAYYGQFVVSGKNDLTLIQAATKNIDDIYKSLRDKYIDVSGYLKDIHNDLHLALAVVKNNQAINDYNDGNLNSARQLTTGLSLDYGYYAYDAKQRAKAGHEYPDDHAGLEICDVLKANQAQFRLIPRDDSYDLIEQNFNSLSVRL